MLRSMTATPYIEPSEKAAGKFDVIEEFLDARGEPLFTGSRADCRKFIRQREREAQKVSHSPEPNQPKRAA